MALKTKRRVFYPYICSRCHKKRFSRKYQRAIDQVCTICRKDDVPENQPSLFNSKEEEDLACGEAMSEASKIGAGDIDEAGDAEGEE